MPAGTNMMRARNRFHTMSRRRLLRRILRRRVSSVVAISDAILVLASLISPTRERGDRPCLRGGLVWWLTAYLLSVLSNDRILANSATWILGGAAGYGSMVPGCVPVTASRPLASGLLSRPLRNAI